MNIFYVHHNPHSAAMALCDKHVVKMLTESLQLLSNAHHIHGTQGFDDVLYKPTHLHHPCSKWVAATYGNYRWLWDHANALNREYTLRYAKFHKAWNTTIFNSMNCRGYYLYTPPLALTRANVDFYVPPMCMPDKYKLYNEPVISYRSYYIEEKSKFAKWRYTSPPDWYLEAMRKKSNVTP